jgi:uncharacterized protein (TIGR03437 family)
MKASGAALACLVLALAGARAQPPSIAGCRVWPEANIWNTRVDTLPVDAKSAVYVKTIGADKPLVPDFGSGTYAGGPIGIPFITVGKDQARVAVRFQYADESDAGPYPIPPDAPVEGGAQSSGDRHVLVLDRDACVLYELYSAYRQPDGSWEAGSGAVFPLGSNLLRPAGWTSADAAGFAIVPGLVRYDEIAAGEIRHAIRFTVPQTRREFVWPATHYASRLTGAEYPPMGQRFRLRADYDIAAFSPANQVILRALKKYGMLLADNGSSWYISGAPDERWDNQQLRELRRLRGSDFEAVDTSSLQVSASTGAAVQAPKGIVNAASGIAQAVSPGEMIVVSGEGIGPEISAGYAAPDGAVETRLNGTVVTFDGIPAPLLSVARDRIDAIVPYGIAGRTWTGVEIAVDGVPTFQAASPAAQAAPALLTVTQGGDGPALAYNEDYILNTESAPARPGSVVLLFGTGEGLIDPPARDGLLSGDPGSKPVLPLSARVAGLPAEIVSAGTVTGMPAGLFQAAIRLPERTPSGKVPLLLMAGPYATQAGVTLHVK